MTDIQKWLFLGLIGLVAAAPFALMLQAYVVAWQKDRDRLDQWQRQFREEQDRRREARKPKPSKFDG